MEVNLIKSLRFVAKFKNDLNLCLNNVDFLFNIQKCCAKYSNYIIEFWQLLQQYNFIKSNATSEINHFSNILQSISIFSLKFNIKY